MGRASKAGFFVMYDQLRHFLTVLLADILSDGVRDAWISVGLMLCSHRVNVVTELGYVPDKGFLLLPVVVLFVGVGPVGLGR